MRLPLTRPDVSAADASSPAGQSRGPAPLPEALRRAAVSYDWLPDPTFVVDDWRRYVVVNRAGCRALRMPRAEILRRRIDDFVPGEMRGRMDQIWADFLRRGRGAREMRFVVPGGSSAVYETNSRAHFLPGYHISMLRNISERTAVVHRVNRRLKADIARRRAIEAALRESEQRYRGVFARTNSAILIFDLREGTVLDANRQAARLYGHRPGEFIGLSLKATAKYPALWNRATRLIRRRRNLSDMEFVRARPDGTEVLLSANASLIDYAGRPAVLAVVHDETARAQTMAALRLSEQRLRAARDASLDAFYILESVRDARGRITDFRFVDVNRRGAALVSRRRQEMIGRNVCAMFPFVRTDGFFRSFVGVVETRKPVLDEFPIAVPAVKAEWIQEHAVPLGDGIAITARDISHEKRAEQTLRGLSWRTIEGQEAERRRVARDLHDGVSQLLAAARFRLQSAEGRWRAAAGEARRDVTVARRTVVAALREVRRISRNLRPGELDDLGFSAAVRGLCREFRERTGLEVELRPGRLPRWPGRGIEESLYRIVQECLTNVERHARARRVWVRFALRRGRVWLRVRDDGRGFATWRGRASDGAGLRNMRERAALAGGTFACQAVPGRGTEILVQIPVKSGKPRSAHGH